MRPGLRKFTLTAHDTSSVGWARVEADSSRVTRGSKRGPEHLRGGLQGGHVGIGQVAVPATTVPHRTPMYTWR